MFGMGTGVSSSPWAPKWGFRRLVPIYFLGGPNPCFDVHLHGMVMYVSTIDSGDIHQSLVKSTSSTPPMQALAS